MLKQIIDWSLADSVDWITKWHNGYIVIGWGAVVEEFFIIEDYIILRFGIEPNGIKNRVK